MNNAVMPARTAHESQPGKRMTGPMIHPDAAVKIALMRLINSIDSLFNVP
jgi:hypothetical protein